ncbi:MAG: hypothetical protein MJ181_11435 [Treponema sp.]|nr:hypothetical protein [Treponema sp.]
MSNNKNAFFKSLIQNCSKSELIEKLKDSPLKPEDILFLSDCVHQLSYNELIEKYQMTKDGIYKRKTRCIERFMTYWLNRESC